VNGYHVFNRVYFEFAKKGGVMAAQVIFSAVELNIRMRLLLVETVAA
jgi:hypothetical protein